MKKVNKNLVVFIISFVVILLSIILIIKIIKNNQIENKLKQEMKFIDNIVDNIDDKKDMLIYITDSHKTCGTCIDSVNIIEYYKSVYNLDFIEFNKSEYDEKVYKELIKKVGLEDAVIVSPAVVIIKEGVLIAVANELVSENYLRNFLVDYNFIDKKYNGVDVLLDLDTFDNIYKSNNPSLIALYSYEKDSYDIRKSLMKLFKKNKFSYYTCYAGFSTNAQISSELSQKIGNNFSIPSLVIVKNKEVVDYINSTDVDKLEQFLKKNKII